MVAEEDNEVRARLERVIAESWQVFGRYEFRRPLEICRCNVCVQPAEEALLLGTPIAEMPASLLQVYTESAHSSGGAADEQFRALLPRYFELIAWDGWPAHSSEITLRRLHDARYRVAWPAIEAALVDRFFAALFAHWLRVHEGTLAASAPTELLGLVALAAGDIDPLLALWDVDQSLSASLRLADFVLSVSWSKRVRRFGAFWDDMADLEAHVCDWMSSSVQKTRLAAAFFATENADEQARLSAAEHIL